MPTKTTRKSPARKNNVARPKSKSALNARFTFSKTQLAIVIGLILVIGGIIVWRVLAATSETEVETWTASGGNTKTVADNAASGGSYLEFLAPTVTTTVTPPACGTVSDKLVPACGAWLGAWSNDHGPTTFRAQIEDHEARIGRQVNFVHYYHGPTNTSITTDEKYFLNRPNTYLLANYKPTATWSQGGGANATVNASIDTFANSVKSVAPNKVMLIIFHEPENDVSAGANCPNTPYANGANSGSPAEYRAMWQNVRNRFDALGVNNVVWTMNYMGLSKWSCMAKDLWPGNNLVDWVMYNPYPAGSETWDSGFGYFYNWMETNSDATHAFSSKPYGIGEWGAWHKDQASVYRFYDDGKAALAAGKFPKIKLYTIFDAIGVDDSRVSHNDLEQPDAEEQRRYNNLVTAPKLYQQP